MLSVYLVPMAPTKLPENYNTHACVWCSKFTKFRAAPGVPLNVLNHKP